MRRTTTHLRRAFTLIELCLGLTVCGLIGLAAVGFLLALAASWKNAETTQSEVVIGAGTTQRLQSTMRGARAVLSWSPGDGTTPARITIWKRDGDPQRSIPADGQIQESELAVIEHVPKDKALVTYQRASGGIDPAWESSFAASLSGADTIKGAGSRQVLAGRVKAVRFHVLNGNDPSVLPLVRFQLEFDRESGMGTQAGCAVLRAPGRIPA